MCLRLTLAVCLAAGLQLSAAAPKTLHTPLFFSENHGQYPAGSRYGAATKGLLLGIEADRATIRIASRQDANTVTMRLVGADPKAAVEGGDRSTGQQSVFLGADPKQWVNGLSLYANVRVLNAYRGIDVSYHGDRDSLEYDFIVAPGADPAAIKLSFTGAKETRLTSDGALELVLPDGTLSHKKPELYQLSHGERRAVDGGFVRAGDSFAFRVGSYDRSAPLIIDPELAYGTYFGTSDGTSARSVIVDSSGRPIIGGTTCGSLPAVTGSYQSPAANCPSFITKFSADGTSLIYSAIIGGTTTESITALAIDAAGAVYFTGATISINFPTTAGAFRTASPAGVNAFVGKLSPGGDTLLYSTYLGGSGGDTALGLAVDSTGAAYVSGATTSSDFPTASSAQSTKSGGTDAFVAKLNASGTALLYSTFLGGTGEELGEAIAVDGSGNAYVTGSGANETFPTTVSAYKHGTSGTVAAFVTKYSVSGAVLYSTLLTEGTSTGSAAHAISVDASGNAIVAGDSDGSVAATPSTAQSFFAGGSLDAFVLKLNAAGSSVIWASYLGGSNGYESGRGLILDGAGNTIVTGETTSTNLPTLNAVYSSKNGGLDSVYRTSNGAASWSSLNVGISDSTDSMISGKSGVNTVLYLAAGTKLLKSTDSGLTWSKIACQTGQVFPFATSRANANYLYWSTASSNDGGSTCIANPYAGSVTAIAADPSVPTVAYMYVNNTGLFKTTNGGITWSAWTGTLPSPISATSKILALAIHPANSNILYAAVQGIGIMHTTDGGLNWTYASVPVSAGAQLVTDSLDANRAYFSNLNLYRTTDGGSTWTQLPSVSGYDLVVDATNGQTLYMQSPQGVQKSTDAGQTFNPVNNGLSNYRGKALAADPFNANVLYTAAAVSVDSFVAKLDPNGALLFSTYVGGSFDDYANAVAADALGNIYVTGFTQSTNLPVTAGSFQTSLNVFLNAFLLKFRTSATPSSVSPSTLTGSGVVIAGFTDALAFSDIRSVEFLLNTTTSTANACYVRYMRVSNTLQLLLDNSTWSANLTPGGSGSVANSQCTLTASGSSVTASGSNLAVSLNLTFAAGFAGTKSIYLQATDAAGISSGFVLKGAFNTAASAALRFVPITPCRIADTRNPSGAFGGPFIASGGSRSFTLPASACSIPVTAQAYSLNLTVVPHGSLPYVTLWPTGQTQPFVSTLNSLDGRVKANAAIVPAGTNGAVSVYAAGETDVVLDINGYFVSATDTSALAFYPLSPCRVADTRNATGALGGPSLPAQGTRSFPVRSTCSVPATAQAYSLNFTAVPKPTLPYLTVWPTGGTKPLVSTLNAQIANGIVANAAIVPAGTNGDVSVYAEGATDVVIDINGYFAPASPPNGLSLYNVSPCRVVDTRLQSWAPALNGGRTFAIDTSCNLSALASAYVMNATVVPSSSLGYLTLWPAGSGQPFVSTLNALDGAITSNAAIVPTNNGSVAAFTTSTSDLVLDVSGFFAP